MKNYRIWVTADKTEIPIEELTDLHLKNIVHKIAKSFTGQDEDKFPDKWMFLYGANYLKVLTDELERRFINSIGTERIVNVLE